MTASASPARSKSRYQSADERARRETSRAKSAPTRPCATSSATYWKPDLDSRLEWPRSSSMTSIASALQPRAQARSRNAYWRWVDSRCSRTCWGDDCRRYTIALRSRCVLRTLSLIVSLRGRSGVASQRPSHQRRQCAEYLLTNLRSDVDPVGLSPGACDAPSVVSRFAQTRRPVLALWPRSHSNLGCQVSGERMPPSGRAL